MIFQTFSSGQWSKLSQMVGNLPQQVQNSGFAAQVSENNDELIEMIPVKAKAGYAFGYSDPEFIKELPTIRLPFLSKNRKYRTFPILPEIRCHQFQMVLLSLVNLSKIGPRLNQIHHVFL